VFVHFKTSFTATPDAIAASTGPAFRLHQPPRLHWTGAADQPSLELYVMKTLFARFAKDESGATAIEYGLIAALIAVAIIAATTQLGLNISNTFFRVAENINK
jgi:pilus assembly protein Flp/PilA